MNRIREIRRKKGITGPELAAKLDITPQYLYGFEKETRTLSAEMASRIASIFEVSVDYLLGRTDESEGTPYIPEWATSRDIRDFKKILEEDEPVMFDGMPISPEDKEKIKRVMEAMFWDAKEKNKKTYGRNKTEE
ncbi:helix-turn-helix domain-containing protein [Paenibacillus polymyxa]|uniref:Helix-turn-helix domain-containing protein n=1 Tax=Paenibacillus polymyxa TaxID=1406 RepID=A0A8I1IPB1_PAEPO|nr:MULTISPECIES: helix-turn-helix transcriptional regulator [Paenibacillus]KAF6576533.1 helix-turn-helix domain-containing protein [Paenibacillus sp. EKM206P]KAF6591333.1 helix-turn-helix domain-containing protein [Paenibacillus sp. EKM205P]MBM0632023.1 helix-turn-helix domain-containing protein [Paenibacillus polymyxa]